MSMQSQIAQVITRVGTEIKSIRSSMGGQKIVKMTLSEHQALKVKDPNTLYFLIWDE